MRIEWELTFHFCLGGNDTSYLIRLLAMDRALGTSKYPTNRANFLISHGACTLRNLFFKVQKLSEITMGLLPDTYNCGLRMRREWRERFPATNFKGKRKSAIPTCITARAWCIGISYLLGRENVPGACATRSFTYLARGSFNRISLQISRCFFFKV